MSNRILLIRPGAIGDTLLVGPSLAALREARAGSELVLVGHPALREVMVAQGLVDRFISRDGPEADALFAATAALTLGRVGPVRAAVAWTADPDGRLSDNLAALGAAPLVVAPSRPPPESGKHVAQHLLDTLAPLGAGGSALDWGGFRWGATRAGGPAGRGGGGPLIVLHPGSGSPRKNWPADRYARLGDRLRRTLGARIVVLLGPADTGTGEAFARAAAYQFETLVEQPLLAVAKLLAGCDLYVGNDSGLSHLAGLSGAPTLALFGPTDPRLWRPLGRRVTVLRRDPVEELSEAEVAQAALEILAGSASSPG
jgi:ADP-heptose:LPS heptosyltransferase